MKFTRKLITPVLATVLLIGGAAFAQDKVMDVIVASDGEVQDAGMFWWQYDADTGEFRWGDPECMSATEITETTEAGVDVDSGEHFGSNCRTVDLTAPRKGSSTDVDSDTEIGSDTEINHGDIVSRVAHDVKEADEAGELPDDANRGSIISQIARDTQELFDHDDDADDSEAEITEVEDEDEDEPKEESERPDKPDKDEPEDEDPPAKAKGKNK